MKTNSYLLQRTDGLWVSSPTHLTSANRAFAGCFSAESEDDLRQRITLLETHHGPLTLVPRDSDRIAS